MRWLEDEKNSERPANCRNQKHRLEEVEMKEEERKKELALLKMINELLDVYKNLSAEEMT